MARHSNIAVEDIEEAQKAKFETLYRFFQLVQFVNSFEVNRVLLNFSLYYAPFFGRYSCPRVGGVP